MEKSKKKYHSFGFTVEGLEGLRQFSEMIKGIDDKIHYMEKKKIR